MDLGCGQGKFGQSSHYSVVLISRYLAILKILLGTVGIYALKECEAAHVHFTDYNEEVIERNLMDSVFINDIEMIEKMSASSGDWSKLELKGEKE